MANFVQANPTPYDRLVAISQIQFTPNCDSIDRDRLAKNSHTLLHYDSSTQQLRVTSSGEFYTLNKGNFISQIFYSIIHFFVKRYREGWNPDASINYRLIQAIDVTFINEIRMVSQEVGSIIQIAKDFVNRTQERRMLAGNPANSLRDIAQKISPAYCKMISTIIKLIKIQNKAELKPSELRLYDTPLPIERTDQIEQEMLLEVAPRQGYVTLSRNTINLLEDFLDFYTQVNISTALFDIETRLYYDLN